MKPKYKKLHKSWRVSAKNRCKTPHGRQGYQVGVFDFRKRVLEALEIFTVLTNYEVFLKKNGANTLIYVSLQDITKLIECLYAEPKTKKIK